MAAPLSKKTGGKKLSPPGSRERTAYRYWQRHRQNTTFSNQAQGEPLWITLWKLCEKPTAVVPSSPLPNYLLLPTLGASRQVAWDGCEEKVFYFPLSRSRFVSRSVLESSSVSVPLVTSGRFLCEGISPSDRSKRFFSSLSLSVSVPPPLPFHVQYSFSQTKA